MILFIFINCANDQDTQRSQNAQRPLNAQDGVCFFRVPSRDPVRRLQGNAQA